MLNAAILLGGEYPVEVHVRRLPKPMVVLESADMGARGEFTAISDLQECHNPYDPFVLHKAALIACGVIPREGGELTDITAKIGGLYVSTQMHGVPKGSGLGTSSILAGACVKALFQYFGVAHTEDDLYEHAMCVEQIMSTGGGWQDQVGGMTPGLKLITAPGGHSAEAERPPYRSVGGHQGGTERAFHPDLYRASAALHGISCAMWWDAISAIRRTACTRWRKFSESP